MSIPKSIELEIVTPEKPIVHDDVDEVQLPGWDGAIGVLPGHAPLLALLQGGELWYRKGQEKTFFVLEFGLAEVLPWVHQWHGEYDEEWGGNPAEEYQAYLDEQRLRRGLTEEALRDWRPAPDIPAPPGV